MQSTVVIIIVSVLAAAFLVLFIIAVQNNAYLKRDVHWLKLQQGRGEFSHQEETGTNRSLDKESVMEAIRFNGFVPEAEDDRVCFKAQGDSFVVDVERLPIISVVRYFSLDPKDWEMDLMREAAREATDNIIMAKVFLTGDNEDDGIVFQVVSIENKYDHFKDCLTRYMDIVNDAQRRFDKIYHELLNNRKEQESLLHGQGEGNAGEKKYLS